jgi:hypothetical protein
MKGVNSVVPHSNSVDFNINIEDYTMDELFKLLSIDINKESNYDNIKFQIETSTDNYIKQFEALQKPEIVDFFMQVKKSLIGSKEIQSTNLQNVIMYENTYKPNEKNVALYGGDMYNQNNGAGNPIHRKSVSKLLNIDSRFRHNYLTTSTTDYMIDLPYPINNVIEMTLCDLELPSTFYPVSELYQNNYFWIKATDSSTPPIDFYYYIVIPDGNYYFQTLVTDIQNAFSKNSLDFTIDVALSYSNLGGVGEGDGLTTIGIKTDSDISLNLSNKFTTFEINFNGSPIPGQKESRGLIFDTDLIDNTDTPIVQYYNTESLLDYKQLFGWIIGFRKPIYKGIVIEPNSAAFYTSESIIDLSGPKYLFLIVDDFNKSMNVNFLTSSVKGLLSDNIIARISQKGQLFSIQTQNDFSVYAEPRYYYGPVNISKLHIKLIDEYGRIVYLNNKDFSFTIRLTTIYSAT